MTTFSQNPGAGISAGSSRMAGTGQSTELSAEQTNRWRAQINECDHPVIVFNNHFQPILLNEALRSRLSEPATVEGTGQPTAFIWQTICETAGRIAAEHARSAASTEIAEAFPVNHRCFVAVGSLIRNTSGHVLGVVLNLADLSVSKGRLQEIFRQSAPATNQSTEPVEANEDFQQWENRREKAVRKMAKLSRRESQVVDLVSDGLPNKSIAHELDISVKTIEKHRANATRKLGVGSTAELVRIAVVAGNKSPEVNRTPPEPPQSRSATF